MGKYTKELEWLRPSTKEAPVKTCQKFIRLYEILCEVIESVEEEQKGGDNGTH